MKQFKLERGPKNIYSLRPTTWTERHQTALLVVACILFVVFYIMAGTDEFKTLQASQQVEQTK